MVFQTSLPTVPAGAEAVSLLGQPLTRPAISEDARQRMEQQLAVARAEYEAKPESVEAAVWVGRRLAYLGRYRDSIEWYSKALERHGASAKLLRHRGHRYLTIRALKLAKADFEAAARLLATTPDVVEPDGVPNARNTPISSLHSNVWYHLALVHFLLGDNKSALEASEHGMKVSGNPDRLVSQSYWQYLILRRLGRHDEAMRLLDPIRPDLDVIENHAYLRLLLAYKGELNPDVLAGEAKGDIEVPTIAFGLGAFALLEGDNGKARKHFERATAGASWPAFGFIASEAELARMR